ncbi:MAG: hypothetical protein Q8O43_04750 [Dehalococcoidia bacterium]|nr:hypothetical protein [Dehalococcoidia bacterium]
MNCFNILTLVFAGGTALGTLGLAVFAFFQIHQVTKEQQLKRKYEIVEFAKNASEWRFKDVDNDYYEKSEQPWIASNFIIMNHIIAITNIMRSGHIISNTLSGKKNAEIKRKVDTLLSELMALRMNLIELRNKIDYTAGRKTIPPEFKAQLDIILAQSEKVHYAGEILFGEVAKRRGV